jgi:hypothetical protein
MVKLCIDIGKNVRDGSQNRHDGFKVTFIKIKLHPSTKSIRNRTLLDVKGLLIRKSDFALGLQVQNTNSTFLYSKMDYLVVKSPSEMGHVNALK